MPNNLLEINQRLARKHKDSLGYQVYKQFTERLRVMLLRKGSDDKKYFASLLDDFQCNYARYLCGITRHPKRACWGLSNLMEHEHFTIQHFDILTDEIENFLLSREMYESLSLFKITCQSLRDEAEKLKTLKNHECNSN